MKKVIVITGASSGIGRAIALGFGVRKTELCLVGRNIEALEETAFLAQRNGALRIQCYQFDLSIEKNIIELSNRIKDDFGHVDILVHSAGMILLSRLEISRVDDFDQQFKINVRSPFLLTQALLPMIKQHRGQIAFINSSAGLNAGVNTGQYASTKHALKGLSDSLRNEVNPYGVRVISIYPGRTATPMQAKVHQMEGKTYCPERLLQPEDVASAVIFALSMPLTAEITDISIRPMQK